MKKRVCVTLFLNKETMCRLLFTVEILMVKRVINKYCQAPVWESPHPLWVSVRKHEGRTD